MINEFVLYYSPWEEIVQSNIWNYQIPCSGLTMAAVDSQATIPKNKKNISKKSKINYYKRYIKSQQPLYSHKIFVVDHHFEKMSMLIHNG